MRNALYAKKKFWRIFNLRNANERNLMSHPSKLFQHFGVLVFSFRMDVIHGRSVYWFIIPVLGLEMGFLIPKKKVAILM